MIPSFPIPAFDTAALRTIKIQSYIHEWEVLCEKFCYEGWLSADYIELIQNGLDDGNVRLDLWLRKTTKKDSSVFIIEVRDSDGIDAISQLPRELRHFERG